MTNIAKKFLPVLFVLVLVFPLTLVPRTVSASPGTIYVPGDYPDIQSAIDAANPSDTILVAAGTYTENVEVDRQLTLTGDPSQPSNVVVDAGGSGDAITLAVDGCVLQGFKVQNGRYGICLDASNNNTLTNNIATSNTKHGIYLDGSNSNTLAGNTVSGNSECGINLDGSNNNTLTGNIVTGNNIGIQIQPSVDASTISVNFNNIYGNTSYGIDNTLGTSNANAENNWWGANDGPSLSPGSGDKVSANVNYEPWIVLGVSPNPASIVADGSSTSTITCDMTINSNGADTSGLGHIPDGTQIIFTTDKGSIGSLQATKETVNGEITAILTSSTVAGTATVAAKAPPHTDVAEDSTTVDFTPGSLHHFTFDTISSPQTAGATFSITITAKDQYENTAASYTGTNTLSDTTGTISPSSTGSFTNGVWAGNVTITGVQTEVTIATTGADKSGTSNSFDVAAGLLDHIVVSPDTATITAGDSQAYTAEAFDQNDNSLGSITSETIFEIVAGAGGSWAANNYTSENIGTWTVAGTYSGKSDTATLTVVEGSLAPTVSIDSPQDGYLTTASTATVEGTVVATPALDEATLTVNGVSMTITVSDETFSEEVSLVIGDNSLTVSASNVIGTDSDSITVTRGSKPVVDITSPLGGTMFQATPITIEGTVNAIPEVTEATLTLNGNASTITVTDGEFSEDVDLVDGENTIVVSATNVAGAGTSSTITVTLNEEAPPTPPPPPTSTTNWWLIGGISGGVVLIAFVALIIFLRSY